MSPAETFYLLLSRDRRVGSGGIVTLVRPYYACATSLAMYTVSNPPRRPGSPAQAGLFVALFGLRP
jgi:hypothetical protein